MNERRGGTAGTIDHPTRPSSQFARAARRPLLLLAVASLGACASTGAIHAQAFTPCELEGLWIPPEAQGGGLVEIVLEEGVWEAHPVNGDGERVGTHAILIDVTPSDEAEGVYEGTLQPDGRRQVGATISCASADELVITGRMMGMSRTVRWQRAETGKP